MKNIIKFYFTKKYENIDNESVFLQYKNIIEEELKKSFFNKYNYQLPNFNLNLNEIVFDEKYDNFFVTENDLIDLDFVFRPKEKTLYFIIDTKDIYNEDYLTKITIKFFN